MFMLYGYHILINTISKNKRKYTQYIHSVFVTYTLCYNIYFFYSQAIDIGKERKKYFLILECDSGHLYGNLISCCRYRIIDKFSKVNDCSTQIILLIHMPRKYPTSNFVSFQSHPWICIHVDELSENIIDVEKLVVEKRKISELFYSDEYNEYMVSSVSLAPIPPRNLCARMFHCIQEAIGNHKTVLSKCHLRIFEKLIPKSPVFPIQGCQNHIIKIISFGN